MRIALRQVLILLLLALIPAIGSALLHPKRPAWVEEKLGEWELTVSDVSKWVDRPLWVDARSASAYDKEHVPGAVALNEDHWDELFPGVIGVWTPEQSIVVYCDSADCDSSHTVAKRLREEGIGPAYVLKGGWKAWKEANP
jgi:rhodanese-related sulfurtransferase